MTRWPGTTSCDQAGQLISLRLDGELSELECLALERHLAACASCRRQAEELEGISRLLRAAPLVEVDLEFAGPAAPAVRSRLVGRALSAAALAAAAVVAALVAFGSSGQRASYSAAPAFRSTQEQVRFVNTEQQRIEPSVPVDYVPVPPQVTARSL
jgi:anti-sigma factor RsiW